MSKLPHEEIVRVGKLMPSGPASATLANGETVLLWNALPQEKVRGVWPRRKRGFGEGWVSEVLKPSMYRVAPRDEAYLSTSPWQIMDFKFENQQKQIILTEIMQAAGVEINDEIELVHDDQPWHYRNKMEYSFFGDEAGLHLALFNRGARRKVIVDGSSIARPEIDRVARKIVSTLQAAQVRASQLKSVIVRCNQPGRVVAALFVKDPDFIAVPELAECADGLAVYYSTPKSPASVITQQLQTYGSVALSDTIDGQAFRYDVNSFFQVNVPMFERALEVIRRDFQAQKSIVDMYSGVGVIGLTVGADTLVELDPGNIELARENAVSKSIDIVAASSESSLDYITSQSAVVFDPPRAGLHAKVVDRVLRTQPPMIAYLSCNPLTQASDLSKLSQAYQVKRLVGYNFFPRTPHIESLAILHRKAS